MNKNSILLIYGALGLGGIETFFLRLAQERGKQNLNTKLLLLSSERHSNKNLVDSISKYCDIFFIEDVFSFPEISRTTALLSPLREIGIGKLIKNVEHIHVTCGYHALFANRIIADTRSKAALTVGFYHSLEFSWCAKKIPYFEKINRLFVLNFLPKENLLLFSEPMIDFYKEIQVDLQGANTFRLGVIDLDNVKKQKKYIEGSTLKIVSVGRLVDFKTYNFWMLDVIKELKLEGISVIYDIYGDGPEKDRLGKKIVDLNVSECVKLRGALEYEAFKKTVLNYDIFIGSGTAIIEASSLGLCCIVGIESIRTPLSYDYFSESYMLEYNIYSKHEKLIPVKELIVEFFNKSVAEKNQISLAHIKAAENFSMKRCVENFTALSKCTQEIYKPKFWGLPYTISYLFCAVALRLNKKYSLHKKYTNKVE